MAISDTHAPRRWKSCPPRVAEHLRGADVILHAGDVCTAAVLDPERLELDLDGLAVAMVHDSGQARGRTARMRRWFPRADLVVFGHSHIPLDETGDGVRIFNPGSPTDRRRQPHGTLGLLDIHAGRLTGARIVPVT